MKFTDSKFEIKYPNTNCWQRISEVTALRILQDNFERIAPQIADMLRGEEIRTPIGVFRIVV